MFVYWVLNCFCVCSRVVLLLCCLLTMGCLLMVNCVYVFILLCYCVSVALLLVSMRFPCFVSLCIWMSIVFHYGLEVFMCFIWFVKLCLCGSMVVLWLYVVFVGCHALFMVC